jgi:hypothetical protein
MATATVLSLLCKAAAQGPHSGNSNCVYKSLSFPNTSKVTGLHPPVRHFVRLLVQYYLLRSLLRTRRQPSDSHEASPSDTSYHDAVCVYRLHPVEC